MRTTEEWLGFLTEESERYQNLILNLRLNDASGLGGRLGKLIRRGRAERPAGLLLTGPAGSGKHNAAWHVLQALDEENCAPVFLSGAGLAEGAEDFRTMAERINALLDRFYDRGQNLCLLLEEPEACACGAQLYPFLGRTLQAYRSYPQGDPDLFMILLAERQPPLSSLLRDMLLICPCTLPDQERRSAFLAERGRTIRNYVSLKRLAELTEGCSYTALGQVADLLGFEIDATEKVPDEETVLRFIRQVTPVKRSRGENPVVEALHRLETVFSDMSEKLANLQQIGAQPVRTQNKAYDPTIVPDPEPNPLPEPDRKSVEEMSVGRLSMELFGEDRVQELLQN